MAVHQLSVQSAEWPQPRVNLGEIEFVAVQFAVLLAPFSSFRHPSVFITVSDCFFMLSLALRLTSGIPLMPLGLGTWLWFSGLSMLMGGLLVSSLVCGDPYRGLIIISQYYFTYACLPLALMCRPYDQCIRLVKCGVISMVLICLFGFAFYFTDYNGGYTRQYVFVTGSGRMASFVDNPNGLAGLIVLALPLLGFVAFARQIRPVTAVLWLATLLTGLILTSSNTGLLAATIGALVFLVGRRSVKMLAGAGVAAYAIIAWGQFFLPAVFQRRVMTAVTSGDVSEAGTYESRYNLMKEAWSMIDQHVWIGLGADQYRLVSEFDLPVHNTYLLLVTEGGAVALLGWLTILAAALLAPWIARNQPHGRLVLLTTITTIVVTTCLSMAYAHMYARFLILPLLLAVSPAVSWRNRSTWGIRPSVDSVRVLRSSALATGKAQP